MRDDEHGGKGRSVRRCLFPLLLLPAIASAAMAQDGHVLKSLKYNSKNPATVQYEELVVRVDSEPSRDGDGRLPFATGRYRNRPAFSMRIEKNGRDEPSAEVRIMWVDASASVPQVVLPYFWGGAHCCTVTKIATVDSSENWHVVDGGALDADGYEFEDLDGDGGNELVSVDNSFLYAFASYAESYAPTRIMKLAGARLADVTRDARYRNFLHRRLREMETTALRAKELHSNGYLGGWVAAKTLVGELDDAWTRMLASVMICH